MTTLSPASAGLTRRILAESWKASVRLWPVAVIVTVVVATVVAQFTPITVSIWEYAGIWPRWFLFSVGVMAASGYFPLIVAHGVTRRDVLTAFGLSGLAVSLLWAVCMAAGMVIERALYSWLGWSHVVNSGYLVDGGSNAAGLFVQYGLLFFGYLTAGALISAAYYRFGWKGGTWLLPFTLLPVIVLEGLLSADWTGTLEQLSSAWHATLAGLIGALLVIGYTGLADYLLLRDVQLPSKTS
jgi:hypothetical protein